MHPLLRAVLLPVEDSSTQPSPVPPALPCSSRCRARRVSTSRARPMSSPSPNAMASSSSRYRLPEWTPASASGTATCAAPRRCPLPRRGAARPPDGGDLPRARGSARSPMRRAPHLHGVSRPCSVHYRVEQGPIGGSSRPWHDPDRHARLRDRDALLPRRPRRSRRGRAGRLLGPTGHETTPLVAPVLVIAGVSECRRRLPLHDPAWIHAVRVCHTDPSGGTLLNEYGRAQSELLLSSIYGRRRTTLPTSRGTASRWPDRFSASFHSPSWLRVGGWIREGYIWNAVDGRIVDRRPAADASGRGRSISDRRLPGGRRAGLLQRRGHDLPEAGTDHPLHHRAEPRRTRVLGGRGDVRRRWDCFAPEGSTSPSVSAISSTPRSCGPRPRPISTRTRPTGWRLPSPGPAWRAEVMALLGNLSVHPDAYRERGAAGYLEVTLAPTGGDRRQRAGGAIRRIADHPAAHASTGLRRFRATVTVATGGLAGRGGPAPRQAAGRGVAGRRPCRVAPGRRGIVPRFHLLAAVEGMKTGATPSSAARGLGGPVVVRLPPRRHPHGRRRTLE